MCWPLGLRCGCTPARTPACHWKTGRCSGCRKGRAASGLVRGEARVAGGEEQGAVRRGENGSGSPEKKQGRRGRSSDGSPRVEQGAAPLGIEQRRPARGGAGRRSAGERAAAAQRRWFRGSAGRIWGRWIEKNIELLTSSSKPT